jgi:hypothetical protein
MKTTFKNVSAKKATQKEILTHKVPGVNFMTPHILAYYFIPHKPNFAQILIEISEGTGFDRQPIYGVTCSNNGKSYDNLSKCLHSENEVIDYINSLK